MQHASVDRWCLFSVALFALQIAEVGARYLAGMSDPLVVRLLETCFDPQTLETLGQFVKDAIWRLGEFLLGIRSIPCSGATSATSSLARSTGTTVSLMLAS